MSASATAPRYSATKPMRVTSHRCGPVPVKASEGELCEALDGADAAVVGVVPPPDGADDAGAEAGADEVGADDAGDDDPVVEPPDPLVVAVAPPVDALANEIAPTARSPLMSPMARTQVSPAAC